MALAIAALAACQQEELADQELHASPEDFVASVEEYSGNTKTYLNEHNQVLWTEDDQVSIFNGTSTNKLYQIKSLGAGNRNATFTLSPDSPVDNDSEELPGNVAVYPYQERLSVGYMYDEGSDEPYGVNVFNLVIQNRQTYCESSFGEESFPMVAITRSASDHQLKFKNLLGAIKLDICGDKAVKSITIIGNTEEPLSGVFTATVPYGNAAPYLEYQNGRVTVGLDCGDGVQLDPKIPTPFFIAVPPTSFEEGFAVLITDTENNNYNIITYAKNIVERSAVLAMPTIVIGGTIDIEEDCVDIPADGSPVEITVNSSLAWEASRVPDWVTVTPSWGEAGTTKVSVTMTGDYAMYDNELVFLEFICGYKSDRVTILKERPISTCAEVLDGIENEEYRIRGLVTDIVNTLYGNFYLEDETGQIYIYGTANKGYLKQFSEQNISIGDIVTLQGPKKTYDNSIIELVNASVIDVQKSLIRINSINLEERKIPIEGGDFTMHVSCPEDNFTVNIPESEQSWVTWTGTEKVNDSEYAVHFTANGNTSGGRIVKILFEYYSDGQRYIDHITLEQEGNIIECTLQEFINAPLDVNVLYRLTGVITEIRNTRYGNFYISDGTTENPVYVYGMTTKGEIGSNDQSFASIGLKEGDTLTLIGVRGKDYYGDPQVGSGSAYQSYYVSHTSPNE